MVRSSSSMTIRCFFVFRAHLMEYIIRFSSYVILLTFNNFESLFFCILFRIKVKNKASWELLLHIEKHNHWVSLEFSHFFSRTTFFVNVEFYLTSLKKHVQTTLFWVAVQVILNLFYLKHNLKVFSLGVSFAGLAWPHTKKALQAVSTLSHFVYKIFKLIYQNNRKTDKTHAFKKKQTISHFHILF